jgi:hypothetical protein
MRARFDDLRARPAVADADLEALWDDAEVLAAALVARQDGLEVTVVERSPTRREVVARTLRALDSGGILVTVGLGPVEGASTSATCCTAARPSGAASRVTSLRSRTTGPPGWSSPSWSPDPRERRRAGSLAEPALRGQR